MIVSRSELPPLYASSARALATVVSVADCCSSAAICWRGPLDLVLERVVGRLGVVVLRGGVVGGAAGRGDACFGLGYGVAGGADRVGRHQQQRKRNRKGEGAAPRRA